MAYVWGNVRPADVALFLRVDQRDDLFHVQRRYDTSVAIAGSNLTSQRVLCSPQAAGTISFVWNELPHCLVGRLDACC
jgi:hypothetical protein